MYTRSTKPSIMKKLTTWVVTFAFLFQTLLPAYSAVLTDYYLESMVLGSPNYQRSEKPAVGYEALAFLEDVGSSGYSLADFHQDAFKRNLDKLDPVFVLLAGSYAIVPTYPLPKLIGTPFVQSRIIRGQLQAQLGRVLIEPLGDYKSEFVQIVGLYWSGQDYLEANNIKFGTPLNIKTAPRNMIWPEYRTINGEKLLVPVVYLSQSTLDSEAVSDNRVQFNSDLVSNQLIFDGVDARFGRDAFIQVTQDLFNYQGRLTALGDFEIHVGGTLSNLSGLIQAQDDLIIKAGNILNQTLVHRFDLGTDQSGRFGNYSQFLANGDLVLRSYGDIDFHGAGAQAGEDLILAADGNIYLGSVQLNTHESGRANGWKYEKSDVEYLPSVLTAEDSIQLLASGGIIIDAAEIVASKGQLEILAGLGITVDTDLSESYLHKKGKFGKRSKEVTEYKTLAMRALLDAGKGIRLHTEYGDISLRGADIRSIEGATIRAGNGRVNLLVTKETDHYSYYEKKKSTFRVKTTQRGHNFENLVGTTIVGGQKVEAEYGLTIEYKMDPNLSFDDQIDTLSQLEGMSWIADVKQNPDIDWVGIETEWEQWDKSSSSLRAGVAALITIAVAVATNGMGGQFLGLTGASGAAASAGFTAIVSQATLSLANGNSISETLEQLSDSESLKSVATTMIAAGIIAKIDADFLKIADDQKLSLGDMVKQATYHSAVQAGSEWVIQGGSLDDLGDSFVRSLGAYAVFQLGEAMAKEIGSTFKVSQANGGNFGLDKAIQYISHAAAGCFTGTLQGANSGGSSDSSGDYCASGALGSVAGELVSDIYKSQVDYDALAEKVQQLGNDMNDFSDTAAAIAAGLDQNQIDDFLEFLDTGDLNVLDSIPDDHFYEILDYSYNLESYNIKQAQLHDLRAVGTDIAKLAAGFAALSAGLNVTVAANNGETAAENNALFLLPVVFKVASAALTAWGVYETTKNVVDLIDKYQDATDETKSLEEREAALRALTNEFGEDLISVAQEAVIEEIAMELIDLENPARKLKKIIEIGKKHGIVSDKSADELTALIHKKTDYKKGDGADEGWENFDPQRDNPANFANGIHNSVDLTEHRRAHILNRHRAGAGKPGKTEFPLE